MFTAVPRVLNWTKNDWDNVTSHLLWLKKNIQSISVAEMLLSCATETSVELFVNMQLELHIKTITSKTNHRSLKEFHERSLSSYGDLWLTLRRSEVYRRHSHFSLSEISSVIFLAFGLMGALAPWQEVLVAAVWWCHVRWSNNRLWLVGLEFCWMTSCSRYTVITTGYFKHRCLRNVKRWDGMKRRACQSDEQVCECVWERWGCGCIVIRGERSGWHTTSD